MISTNYLESDLSRIINTEGVGKRRNKYTREVVLAIRQLMVQSGISEETRDLAAFIALRLQAIFDTIEVTVAPWEKRDYWVKADRFRMDWAWSGDYAKEMRQAVFQDNWPEVAVISTKTAEKLKKIEISARHRLGEPWHGVYQNLIDNQSG